MGEKKKKKKRSKKNLRGHARVVPTSLGFQDGWATNSPGDIFVTSQRTDGVQKLPLRHTVSSPALYGDATENGPGVCSPPQTPGSPEQLNTNGPVAPSSYARRGPVPRRLGTLRTFSSLGGVNSPRDEDKEDDVISISESKASPNHVKYLKGNIPATPVKDSPQQETSKRPPVPRPRRPPRPVSMPCPPPPPVSDSPSQRFSPRPPPPRLPALGTQSLPPTPTTEVPPPPDTAAADLTVEVVESKATDVLEDVEDELCRESECVETALARETEPVTNPADKDNDPSKKTAPPTNVSPEPTPPVSPTATAPAPPPSLPAEDCATISVTTSRPVPRPRPRHTATMTVGIGGVRRVSVSNSEPLQVASAVQPVATSTNTPSTNVTSAPTSRAPAPRRPLLLRVPYEHWTPVPLVVGDNEKDHLSSTQLFNLLNDGQLSPYVMDPTLLLMVDVRESREYREHHIVTARHREDLPDDTALSEYTHIVLYDAEGHSYSLTDSAMSETMTSLQDKGLSPVILTGGYRTFQARYPFLCSPQIPLNERERQIMLTSYPTEVLDEGLFLGNGDQAENVSVIVNLGITHIVNICRERGCPFRHRLSYLPIALDDEPCAQIGRCFQEVSQFIYDALGSGGHVLVHCNLGVSRSATVVLAYLMFTRRCTLEAAFHFLKERRPTISPNRGFWRQLAAFERKLYGKKLTEPDDLWMWQSLIASNFHRSAGELFQLEWTTRDHFNHWKSGVL